MTCRLAPILVVVLSVAACGGKSTPTSPTASDIVVIVGAPTATSPSIPPGTTLPSQPLPAVPVALLGNWSGQITDPVSGPGTLQLSLGNPTPTGQPGTW